MLDLVVDRHIICLPHFQLNSIIVMPSTFKIYQYILLLILWCAYASSYLLRKPFSLIKTNLVTDLDISLPMLGWLDMAMLLPYGVVSLTMGWVADKFGSRRVFGIGLVLGGLTSAALSQANNAITIAVLLFIVGSSQSLGWPSCSAILSMWFPASDLNYAFGIFGTSCFAGSVLSTYFAVYLLDSFHWRFVFIPCALIPGILGVLIILFAYPPKFYGLSIVDDRNSPLKNKSPEVPSKSLSFLEVMKLDVLPQVCLSILCCKCVRYAILLWLPMFLEHGLSYSTLSAGIGSTAFDIGGILGSVLNGFFVDYFFRSNNLYGTFVSGLLTCLFLGLFFISQDFSMIFHMVLLAIAGAFNSACDILLTGPIAADFGAKHNARVAISGVVNGVGSLGAVIQGPIVGWLSHMWGWMTIVPFLMMLNVVGALASLRAYKLQDSRNSYSKLGAKDNVEI